jgi:hypothetical protein
MGEEADYYTLRSDIAATVHYRTVVNVVDNDRLRRVRIIFIVIPLQIIPFKYYNDLSLRDYTMARQINVAVHAHGFLFSWASNVGKNPKINIGLIIA